MYNIMLSTMYGKRRVYSVESSIFFHEDEVLSFPSLCVRTHGDRCKRQHGVILSHGIAGTDRLPTLLPERTLANR